MSMIFIICNGNTCLLLIKHLFMAYSVYFIALTAV